MSRHLAGALVALLIVACGQKPSSVRREDDVAPRAATPAPAVSGNDAHARRASWLEIAAALSASPATIPRLSDATAAASFEALVSEAAWLELDGAAFGRDGEQLIAFFPAAKALSLALVAKGAIDESVLLMMYMDRVEHAFIGAGREWMASLGEAPEQRANREQGLTTVQLGKAMNLCGLLASVANASTPVATRALEHLSKPATYANDSTAGLQLVLATLDANPAPAPVPAGIEKVQKVIATAYERRVEAAGARPAERYEALPIWNSFEHREVVSRAGGFAITVGPGALVWSTETPMVATMLQWRDGDFVLEVICIPGVSLESLASRLLAAAGTERTDQRPGRWIVTADAQQESLSRVVSAGSSSCVAAATAPKGKLDARRADAMVGSFRAAP